MNATINSAVASEHVADLRRAAAARRIALRPVGHETAEDQVVALRIAHPEDERDLSRIAQLDDADELVGPALLAVVDGDPVAAISLVDGRIVANPFVRTHTAVALLRLRAEQLAGERHHRWRPRVLRPRAA